MIGPDKKIQELLKGNFEEPTPSVDFTHNIMAKIATREVAAPAQQFEYVPIISKNGWILIVSLFLAFVFLGLTGSKQTQFNVTNYLPEWHVDISLAHSQLLLLAVLSIFALLLIDRLLLKFRLS